MQVPCLKPNRRYFRGLQKRGSGPTENVFHFSVIGFSSTVRRNSHRAPGDARLFLNVSGFVHCLATQSQCDVNFPWLNTSVNEEVTGTFNIALPQFTINNLATVGNHPATLNGGIPINLLILGDGAANLVGQEITRTAPEPDSLLLLGAGLAALAGVSLAARRRARGRSGR